MMMMPHASSSPRRSLFVLLKASEMRERESEREREGKGINQRNYSFESKFTFCFSQCIVYKYMHIFAFLLRLLFSYIIDIDFLVRSLMITFDVVVAPAVDVSAVVMLALWLHLQLLLFFRLQYVSVAHTRIYTFVLLLITRSILKQTNG